MIALFCLVPPVESLIINICISVHCVDLLCPLLRRGPPTCMACKARVSIARGASIYEWDWKAPQDLGLAVYLGVNTWGLRGVVCMAMNADIC